MLFLPDCQHYIVRVAHLHTPEWPETDTSWRFEVPVFGIRFWCKYLREAQQGTRRSKDYAASTAFQIAGAVWFLRCRRPRENCLLRIRRSSSIPAMVVAAQSKSLKPSIGPVRDLIPR